jgi:hypothetical protein
MKYLFQIFINNISFITFIIVIIFLQLLFIQINFVGIFLFSQILLKRDIYRTVSVVLISSLIYDSIKLNPIGLWAVTFYFSALIITIIARLIKINEDINTISKISLIPLIFLISAAGVMQTVGLSYLEGYKMFDYSQIYSIVALSTLYTVFIKITARPDKLALPHI